jgi:effector-binding domain-containing protein
MEVGAEIGEEFEGNGRIVCSRLPSGLAATTTHFGPYQGLSSAYSAIETWCKAHGRKFKGTAWEIYGHWEDAWNRDSSKIRTDVFQLIESG